MIILANLIVLLLVYLFIQNTFLKKKEYTVYFNNLPRAFDDFKIAQISDFHNTRSRELKRALVRQIDEAAVNLTVITGDFIDSRRTDVKPVLEFASMIKGISEIIYIPGNHESRKPEIYKALKTSLKKEYNIISLDNTRRTLERQNSKINVYGLRDADFYIDQEYVTDSYDEQEEATRKAVKNLNMNDSTFNILLAHRPEFFEIYTDSPADLILSGHAHGGQMRIPFKGGVFAPNQGFFPEYCDGVHTRNKKKMIVSRGIGNSVFPFRINNRPELVIIHLKRGNGKKGD